MSSPRTAFLLRTAAVALTLVALGWDASKRIAHLNAVANVSGALIQPVSQDRASPTGYENGARRVILPRHAIDGYHWLMQTQQMFARDEARVRHVDYDNAPDGREVHWASPFRWWLGLLAWLDHQVTREPPGRCVERAGLYAGPLLLGVFLTAVAALFWRRLGAGLSTWLVLGIAGSMPLHGYFSAGNPDHHGAAAACALLTLLGLIAGGAGWVGTGNTAPFPAPPSLPEARRWFAFSACFGGLGLWISAASQTPVLVAIGLGAACSIIGYKRNPTATASPVPELWRTWGRWGSATSVAAWLIEYSPAHLGWRLEVNHPLYALAWWAAGEMLACWWREPRPGAFLRALVRPAGLMWSIALLALPAVVLVAGPRVFRISDPFLWALHHEYISEFQNVVHFFSAQGSELFFWATLLPILLAFPACLTLLRQRAANERRGALLLCAVPAAVFALLAATQVRWLGLFHAFLVLAIVAYRFTRHDAVDTKTRRRHRVFAALALLALAPQVHRCVIATRAAEGMSRDEIIQATAREIAHWFNRRAGAGRPVVAAGPGLSTTLAFHGGVKTLGTLYWENLDGLQTSASLFGARSEAEAFRVVQAAGVTHLVFVSWHDFSGPYVKLVRGLRKDDPAPDDAFVLNLITQKTPPPWLRPVPCVLPENPALEDAVVFVYEVVPPQSREESLVRLVHFLVDSDSLAQAVKFIPALEQYPRFFPAQIARARLELADENKPAFLASMRRLLAQPAPPLALEDRIQFALLLAVIGADTDARQQFEQCWRDALADRAAFRKLAPSAIAYLFQQSARLRIPAPTELEKLGHSLLPPRWISQL